MDGNDDSTEGNDGNELAEAVVQHEWQQFQQTDNEGGRAACQGNWPMFRQMRLSQFLTWPEPLLNTYAKDLDEADRTGRNLITEKYGRMMSSTAPDEYRRDIEPYIPKLPDDRVAAQDQVIATQVDWALEFRTRYPRLGNGMRVLHTAEDTPDVTSFETYLRGELGTYSQSTFDLYRRFIDELKSQNRNLTEETVRNTALLGGFASLEEAEALQ
ncbi:DUF4125 family protein [Bifidobacterium subtile]|jgi:hypothetical protein|uniref:DUF4125 domain-containing protein n=1 Tax=Bifidobacterium subtile TaxID=77635 RepID=A0A087E3U5_9BIFI|nr:DUF4125 family protein [Bifidobacterium subtile]KFJ02446.1 hypothetical protein BISU_1645 [Bifidobacterium subtile]MCI1223945.1 DUF4125 family protein [Bifidobacterium subtile]MCI1240672.1 DUF4125 family protein [Bifidobacterium subtile]MCI1257713.1 DUF4125 family protein [Bifidobacterium subtile]QOL35895.1 DUF4125 family protein [Bifidobacterium subtile]